MVEIISGVTKKPSASKLLQTFFEQHKTLEGSLYIGYPIIGTAEGPFPIDAMWISEKAGLTIFHLIEGPNLNQEDVFSEQDDIYNKMEAKLKVHKELMERRTLCVQPNVVTYAPAFSGNIKEISQSDAYIICNTDDNLFNVLQSFQWGNSRYYEKLLSTIQAVSTIRSRGRRRFANTEHSRGAKLKSLEDSIATLDRYQGKAVIETVDGVQRIRGLAGSGKTIVLALKAAYLHAQHPEWKIAVTFNTRSLKGQFKRLINTFYIEHTNMEPDWDRLSILNAWGAPGDKERSGIYYIFCKEHNIQYYDFSVARMEFSQADNLFHMVCQRALDQVRDYHSLYDAILIDEAQDFSPAFLKMCYEILAQPKRLIYAYDELQNLGTQSLPSPETVFGNDANGNPRVIFNHEDIPQKDVILEKCYRNSRPVLTTAHALGFGIYRKNVASIGTGLVQMFEEAELWEAIGYRVEEGTCADGQHVVLRRTPETSPSFLEEHSELDDLIVFKSFDSVNEQNHWVANEIARNLREDELRFDDIVVINPNPLTTRQAVAPIRAMLFDQRIQSHTAGVDTSPDEFFSESEDSITFTGIYRAKGNEAAMVYVINAQDCYDDSSELAKLRNELFTAITRSKAWVRVLGVGENMAALIREFQAVKEHEFKLDFIYPTVEQRKHLKIVNRDKSNVDRTRVSARKKELSNLIDDLKNGKIFMEDFPPEQIEQITNLLRQGR